MCITIAVLEHEAGRRHVILRLVRRAHAAGLHGVRILHLPVVDAEVESIFFLGRIGEVTLVVERGRETFAVRTDVEAAVMVEAAEIDIRVAGRQRQRVIIAHRQAVSEGALLHVGDMAARGRRHIGNAERVRIAADVAVHIARRDAPVARVVVAGVRHGDGRRLGFLPSDVNRQRVAIRRRSLEVGADLHRTAVVDELDFFRELVDVHERLASFRHEAQDVGLRHAIVRFHGEGQDRHDDMAALRALHGIGRMALSDFPLLCEEFLAGSIRFGKLVCGIGRCSCRTRRFCGRAPSAAAQAGRDARNQRQSFCHAFRLMQSPESHHDRVLSYPRKCFHTSYKYQPDFSLVYHEYPPPARHSCNFSVLSPKKAMKSRPFYAMMEETT